MWDAAKVVLREKVLALSASIRKEERCQINKTCIATSDSTDIESIVSIYHAQLYAYEVETWMKWANFSNTTNYQNSPTWGR